MAAPLVGCLGRECERTRKEDKGFLRRLRCPVPS